MKSLHIQTLANMAQAYQHDQENNSKPFCRKCKTTVYNRICQCNEVRERYKIAMGYTLQSLKPQPKPQPRQPRIRTRPKRIITATA